MAGKERPRLLFIPTASSDSERLVEAAEKHFASLGCEVDVLYLVRETPSYKAIKNKVETADIIYVGGGNTLMMMRKWRRLGVDKLVRKAYAGGTVLSGLSAGAICLFTSGHSDSLSFYNPEDWGYIRVHGMGLIPATVCPHYDSETKGKPREHHFKKMMGKGGMGIALEDNCALEVVDGQYRLITSQAGKHAYLVYREKEKVIQDIIPKHNKLKPLDELLTR